MIALNKLAGWGAATIVTLALCAGAAQAQPTTKAYALDQESTDLLWCTVVFYEESFWHEVETPEEIYYNEMSLELEDQALAAMGERALSEDQSWELWEAYADFAYNLYETDNGAFVADLSDCETRFGNGGPAASTAPEPGAASK